jgi:enoyl-CoA hydratase
VTINNGTLNLFEQAVFDALTSQIADLAAAPPRAVLLQAQGKVTSAGVDVHLFDGLDTDQGAALWRSLFDGIIHPLEALPCPLPSPPTD